MATTLDPVIGEYRVCALPDTHPAADLYTISVRRARGDLWEATRWGASLDAVGHWSEPTSPSYRTPEWLDRHLHTLETAIRLAQDAAPHLTATVFVDGQHAGTRTAAQLAAAVTP